MKKIASISCLLSALVFLPSPAKAAVADFSGHWVADKGTVSSNVGLHSECSAVTIDIEQTSTKLTVKQYKSECALFGSTWGPSEMTLKDGKVFEDGEEVGTISGDTLITISPSGTAAYAFNLKLIKGDDGQSVLESYYGVKNGVGAIATEANHRRVTRSGTHR
jgi:hypothetical protein